MLTRTIPFPYIYISLTATLKQFKLRIMKKSLLLAGALFAGTASMAQLADGSIAPDFTVQDINGNTHTLYDYLDQGYTVVLDLNATWCPPCWTYHQNGALEDLWMNHGPAGGQGVSASTTDDVIVMMIESDNSTTSADLNGTGSNTLGDWVTGTDFIIVDDASVASLYNLAYYPTIYTVCPNRTTTETGQLSATQHYANVGNCPTQNAGTDATILSHNGDEQLCGAGSVPVTVDIQNSGSTTLTSLTINVMDGATQLATQNWTGSMDTWDIETVNLGNVNVSGATTLTIEITDADNDMSNNTINKQVDLANLTSGTVNVEIYLDNYPAETTWELRDGSGSVVGSGGPYQGAGGTAAGGPDALTVQTHQVTLPDANDCYSFYMADTYGDGLEYGTNVAGLFGARIVKNGAVILDFTDGGAGSFNFGSAVTRDAAARTEQGVVGIDEEFANSVSLYPNPVADVATIELDNNGQEVVVEVYSITGQRVSSNNYGATNLITLDASNLTSGVYFVNILVGEQVATKKITIQ